MPRDSGGTYTPPPSYLAVTGQTILASQHNPVIEDMSTALTGSLPRNGSAGMQTALPMGGYQITSMADGVLPTDAATVGQSSTAAATAITTAPLKTTPVDADTIPLVDSAAGNIMKRLTWANLKALFQPANAVLLALAGIGTAVAGDIIYSSAAGVWARRAKGTDGQVLSLAGGLPTWATVSGGIFTKSFESSRQTLTAGGLLTLAHGLGTTPKLYMVVLQCTTSNMGFAINDEVAIAMGAAQVTATGRGISIWPDATNMNVRFGDDAAIFNMLSKGGGVNSTITPSSWRLVVRAWA